MGTWSLISLETENSPIDPGVDKLNYGTNFQVTYKLRYKPSYFTKFKEPPNLDWYEKIYMKFTKTKEYWRWEGNWYNLNPASKTLMVWMQRYKVAYQNAILKARSDKGNSFLLDTHEAPIVAADVLEEGLTQGAEQAEEVRNYLKEYGGFLKITVHDVPGIIKRENDTVKERLLLFDVGLVGNTKDRRRAEQYLYVDPSKPEAEWIREFTVGDWTRDGIQFVGDYAKIDPPEDVSKVKIPEYPSGGYGDFY
jgi:hypothetical protein